MKAISLAEAVDIHEEIIATSGGAAGVLSRGTLEGCLERHLTFVFGFEAFKGIFEKVGALMECIMHLSPFADGNKRTGMVLAGAVLQLNGYVLSANVTDAIAFSLRVASSEIEITEIAAWLMNNSTFIGDAS
jgi:death on curing protein